MSDTTNTETTLWNELEEVVAAAKVDYEKLREKGVQARATAFRKKMQLVKDVAQKLRTEALELRSAAKERKSQAKAS